MMVCLCKTEWKRRKEREGEWGREKRRDEREYLIKEIH